MPITTFDPIYTGTLNSNTSFITIGNIPQTYTDLLITFSGYSNVTGDDIVMMYFNNDTSSNYMVVNWTTYNPTPTIDVSRVNATDSGYFADMVLKTAGQIGNGFAYLPQYTATNKWKTFISRMSSWRDGLSNGTTCTVYKSTSAITTLNFRTINGYQFAANSLLTVYGLKGS